LAQQSDHPENSGILPKPELNPLLNPTLGKHMGRWAEVYFKSPPEKRDEAVQQLVRELESEAAAADSSQFSPSLSLETSQGSLTPQAQEVGTAERISRSGVAETAFPTANSASEDGQSVTCFWCGYVNRSQYKFCGRCGETLGTYNIHGQLEDRHDGAAAQPERPLFSSPQAANSAAETEDFLRQKIHGFRSLEDSPTLHLGQEPSARSFRPWFAAVLAAILAALIYVAWRGGTPASPQASSPQTSSPQVSPPQVTSPQATPSQASSRTGQPGAATSFAQPATNTPPHRDAEAAVPPATTPIRAVSSNPAAPSNAATPNAGVIPPETGPATSALGGEELAVARDFLDGTHGRQRDPSEAAQWLWKSVRKENAEATVLLSDLYLRGDGVAKSCEQAHLLLDAAAIKGRKDAAARLQNLSAFGCR
jgi:hypothetical protein